MSNETQEKLFSFLLLELGVAALNTDLREIELIVLGDQHNIVELEADRLEWSLRTFPKATPISSLRKLESEIKEIETDINNGVKNPTEYADALMVLFDSAGRQGITPNDIFKAFAEKLAINKARQWSKNPDNSYSHIKG